MENKLATNLNYWYNTDEMPASKQKVLASAIKLFSTKGYDKTSTNEISQDADVSQAIIFKYFHSKAELLNSILSPVIKQLIPTYADQFLNSLRETKLSADHVEEGIYYLISERFYFMYRNSEIIIILISQALTNEDVKAAALSSLSKKQDKLMRLMWHKYKDLTGSKDKEAFQNFVSLIVTQVMSYFFLVTKIAPNDRYDFEKDLRRFARNVYLTL
ncbi:TetR/AcrR family transcriptional regulator [Xylocopilactobacillus apicola]|uniref:HTH tetR-type domain-containing protein n=1 Tax=Xylocopilactobacillus apicola TaxID=2932184 RepID=A0AAU9CZ86_9LACO|nr:TetR/AcrR family transcriptional regulator [Xylocopilactobacillus apicola]BDR59309.1 hypothetical protein XA3_17500 [Xylocopilactobacillus apicola]